MRDDVDRRRFAETLEEVVEASGWVVFGLSVNRSSLLSLHQTSSSGMPCSVWNPIHSPASRRMVETTWGETNSPAR